MVNVQTLEKCFNGRNDNEMGNTDDTVEDKIRNATFTAIDIIIIPRIELSIKSINPSSGRDAASVTANSERGERIGITALFETYPKRTKHFVK